MWHEARKQERKIRGMLVDYRRRAERRRDFYEKIKADPTQFMQLHGRAYKIHLDPNVAAAAESSSTMMPWQGQTDNMIDRFDARAHLDHIPTYNIANDIPDMSAEERQCNYERYRVLVQNSFLGISEEKFLRQLHLEEQYGYTADLDSSKKKKGQGAAIGFNYDDVDGSSHPQPTYKEGQKEESDDSDVDVDFDLAIDISKIEMSQAHELNKHGQNFGMSGNDFYSFLTNDMEEAENLRAAREEEEERALYSGRRSRRARRAHQEKRLHNRIISPPSYAAKEPDKNILDRRSRSTSKSVSPVNTGVITYITSFGDDDNEIPSVPARPMTYAEKVKAGPSKNSTSKRRSIERRIRYRSRSHERKRRSSSSSRSRSRSRRRSRSNSNNRWRYKKRSRSRSISYRINRKKSASSCSSSRSRSRSKLKTTRSSSKSSTTSLSSTSTKSRSVKKSPSKKSASPKLMDVNSELTINKPLPRYYGRRKSDKSSSELEDLSGDDSGSQKDIANKASERKLTGLVNTKTGAASKQGNAQLKPQERLKRKMQILLNKQYKADKKAQQLRNEKLEQEARERDDQMRELALKLRRRHRELRNYGDSSTSNSGSEFETSKDDYDIRGKSPSSSHGYRSRRSLERRDRELSSERRSRTHRDRELGKYRDRSRDRSEREYRRRRYSDDDRSSRDYRSRRERSRSSDSDHRRHSRSADSKNRENSSNRKPLVDY